VQGAHGLSGGVDQTITPRWLAKCVTRKTGTEAAQGGTIPLWNKFIRPFNYALIRGRSFNSEYPRKTLSCKALQV
jgi:hypothetical protein